MRLVRAALLEYLLLCSEQYSPALLELKFQQMDGYPCVRYVQKMVLSRDAPSLVHQPCRVTQHVPGTDIHICASITPPSPISAYRVTDSAAPGGFGRPTGSSEPFPGCGLGRDGVCAALDRRVNNFLVNLLLTSLIVFLSIAKRF